MKCVYACVCVCYRSWIEWDPRQYLYYRYLKLKSSLIFVTWRPGCQPSGGAALGPPLRCNTLTPLLTRATMPAGVTRSFNSRLQAPGVVVTLASVSLHTVAIAVNGDTRRHPPLKLSVPPKLKGILKALHKSRRLTEPTKAAVSDRGEGDVMPVIEA